MPGLYIETVEKAMNAMTEALIKYQGRDGQWNFCFEGGVMTDAYMILLCRLLGHRNKKLINSLLTRIESMHTQEGAWKLFSDEKEGNLSATIEACMALLVSGRRKPGDPMIKRARDFIEMKGGLKQAGSLTSVMLALTGNLDWSNLPKIPVEFLLLPSWSPVNFMDFVGFTRVHVAPVLIAADSRFSVHLDKQDQVSTWLNGLETISSSLTPQHEIWTAKEIAQSFASFSLTRRELHQQALRYGEKFMLSRREVDGTLYSYFSSTFLMIFALLSLGYPKEHKVIQKAFQGLLSFYYPLENGAHIQETSSTVWDTSLILYALQEAGLHPHHMSVRKGVRYLLSRQQTKKGDWAFKNQFVEPGGWGFSDINTINPDVDDTTYSLRAIASSMESSRAWKRGVHWLLSMQNLDGGWSAFEKNTNKAWLYLLPKQGSSFIWGDPSSADLTGRTLEFLGRYLKWKQDHPVVIRAINWLRQAQQADGSWFGRWGVAYLYGTWAALTGLASVGVSRFDPMVDKALRWLYHVQNEDGGWGESCYSDLKKRYVPLEMSTPSQTAWALDALIAFHDEPTHAIEAGMACLLELLIKKEERSMTYPTGAGLSGQFYIHYHSYRYVWPLVTFSHYHQKYGEKKRRR